MSQRPPQGLQCKPRTQPHQKGVLTEPAEGKDIGAFGPRPQGKGLHPLHQGPANFKGPVIEPTCGAGKSAVGAPGRNQSASVKLRSGFFCDSRSGVPLPTRNAVGGTAGLSRSATSGVYKAVYAKLYQVADWLDSGGCQ